MHIAEGFLPARVCIVGYAITGVTTWYSLRQIDRDPDTAEQLPKASLLAAAFFAASSIHVPIPPASVHFVLNGLLGATLGYYAFPAILIGLFFQAVMFQHGGLSTLGVNAAMMGIPALLAYHIFQLRHRFDPDNRVWISILGFVSGAIGLGLATLVFVGLIVGFTVQFDAATQQKALWGLTLAHLPMMAIEGTFTAMVALFLRQVKPELLSHR
jgi:cobalt/nickel transport system permease protein